MLSPIRTRQSVPVPDFLDSVPNQARHGFPPDTLMLAFRSGGSTGDVKTPWNSSTCEQAAVGRGSSPGQRERQGTAGCWLRRGGEFVGSSPCVARRRKCTQLYVNAGGRVYCTNIVFQGKSVSVCDGPHLEHKHVTPWTEVRECLRKFAGVLVWQNRVPSRSRKVGELHEGFPLVFSH